MIDPPTDRLHKFLAILGLTMIVFGFSSALDSYHSSEMRRIEFMSSFGIANDAYGDFAESVNQSIALHNAWVKNPSSANRKALDVHLQSVEHKQELLLEKARLADNANIKDLDTFEHFQMLRNVWYVLAGLLAVAGAALSYIGFRQWVRQPKRTR